MSKRAISVTLANDNVTWLKGRAGPAGESVSGLIDQLVTAARQSGRSGQARSVAGTIDIDASDPLLKKADAALRAAFEGSLGPFDAAQGRRGAVREAKATHRVRRAKSRKPRG